MRNGIRFDITSRLAFISRKCKFPDRSRPEPQAIAAFVGPAARARCSRRRC